MTEPPGRLAIVTSVVGKSTEISQRRHINELFGGNTAIVCYSVEPGFTTGKPMLHVTRRPPGLAPRAELELGKAWNTLRWQASGVPFGRVRDRVEAFLRENRCFAILAEFGHLGSSFAPVGQALGIPVFVYFRGFDASKRLSSPLRVLSYRAAIPRLAGWFSVSQSLLDNLAAKGLRHPNSHVIPSGVDTDLFAPAEKDPDLVLAVGRMIPKKAPLVTIAAFARAAADLPSKRLEMIGDGPLLDPARAEAARLGVAGRVSFLGLQPHAVVRDKMARAAVFAQHSVTDAEGNEEGLPIAIQEAMASGAVVVSTIHAGIPDAVTSGADGILVPEHDLEGYTAALRSVLADAPLRRRLAEAARARAVTQFDTRVLHRRIEDIIRAATGAPA
ncbi:glycosyltransferase [Amaricoccus sp.]|uniref:glycosyltransferase n=1 Tax=Amaricoccus sp. TaxID=1872485 RepID=UPI001B6FEBDB|nr:glycosyltransferase [Amaricoccus sp.]MBP6999986.1 glycosyltransferase [Amaricoccus sp.]